MRDIKAEVITLIDANEVEFKETKLPMKFFNIDVMGIESKTEAHNRAMERMKCKLKDFCAEQMSTIHHIKQHTWDAMATKARKLRSISNNLFVENYPLSVLDEKLSDEHIIEAILKNPGLVKSINEFQPWTQKTISHRIIDVPTVITDCERSRHMERFSVAATKIIDKNLRASATSSHLFITPIATQSKDVDIQDENQVYEHSLRVFVRIAMPSTVPVNIDNSLLFSTIS